MSQQFRPLHHLLAEEATDKTVIATAFEETRARSRWLLDEIPEHHLMQQVLPYLSPPLWDFNHMANVEEKWLNCTVGGQEAMDAQRMDTYDMMLHPRVSRGALPISETTETTEYWALVRQRTLQCLNDTRFEGQLEANGFIWWNVISHEHQHQETVLQSMDRYEDYTPSVVRPHPTGEGQPGFIEVDAGLFRMGLDLGAGLSGASYDCEAPKHEARTKAYQIGRYPVSNGEYLEFLEAGGYEELGLWDEAGQAWLRTEPHHAPLDWFCADGVWHRRNLLGTSPVREVKNEILTHISHHEATAYANWCEARLPSETEWEKAARFDPETGASLRNPFGDQFANPGHDANCDVLGWTPSTLGAYAQAASPLGMEQAIGEVWEWTSDRLRPYPGFEPFPYKDYSETWYQTEQWTLRGGSWATRPTCATATFRNWDLPHRRQIHSGIRLARDA